MPEQISTGWIRQGQGPTQIDRWRTVDHLEEKANAIWDAYERGEATLEDWKAAYMRWWQRSSRR